MKKFIKILAVILAVPVAIFLGICGWCIYDVFLTDNWENYTQTEEYKMKQEQRRIEEEKQAELEEQEKKEVVKEEPKKEEKKVETNQETEKVEEKKETVKEEPKKVDNEIEEEIKYAAYRAVSTYNGNELDLDDVFDIIRNREVGFHHEKPYFGLKVEEGRTMMIKYILEAEDVKEIQGFDEKDIFDMCTVMIENNFIYVEEYFEFIKTPEEKQADKNLLNEMKEFTAQIAIIEANKYEPVEEWKKESTGRNYRNSIHLILHNSLINEFPEASEEQRMEAINYAKEVFVENFPTIE